MKYVYVVIREGDERVEEVYINKQLAIMICDGLNKISVNDTYYVKAIPILDEIGGN